MTVIITIVIADLTETQDPTVKSELYSFLKYFGEKIYHLTFVSYFFFNEISLIRIKVQLLCARHKLTTFQYERCVNDTFEKHTPTIIIAYARKCKIRETLTRQYYRFSRTL